MADVANEVFVRDGLVDLPLDIVGEYALAQGTRNHLVHGQLERKKRKIS